MNSGRGLMTYINRFDSSLHFYSDSFPLVTLSNKSLLFSIIFNTFVSIEQNIDDTIIIIRKTIEDKHHSNRVHKIFDQNYNINHSKKYFNPILEILSSLKSLSKLFSNRCPQNQNLKLNIK